MTKVSFIIPARNKAAHVAACFRSVLAQTYSPFEIVISDQGSTDSTLRVIENVAGAYNGPNAVRVLRCPDTGYTGMLGLNAHLNWLRGQVEADLVIMCSADDWNHRDRVALTVRAFEDYHPSYINTGVQYCDSAGKAQSYTDFPKRDTRWLEAEEVIRWKIGSSGSSAWASDLWQDCGDFVGCEQQDMILPMLALAQRGIYYVDAVLHHYFHHASPHNAGFGGQILAATNDPQRAGLVELNNFIHVYNWHQIFRRWQSMKAELPAQALAAASLELAACSDAWSAVRNQMILSRIAPQRMNV